MCSAIQIKPIKTLSGRAASLWIQNFELARQDYPQVSRKREYSIRNSCRYIVLVHSFKKWAKMGSDVASSDLTGENA